MAALIEKGADVNRRGGKYGTALQVRTDRTDSTSDIFGTNLH